MYQESKTSGLIMSDLNSFVDNLANNKNYMRQEDEYMNTHPIGNKKVGQFHPSSVDQHLANSHSGIRTPGHVRMDIRTGMHMLKDRPNGGDVLSAERIGYRSRQHMYLDAEKKAKGNR